jgi:two-component system, OmpR family, phosphate regulon sensor histidine kinase PhoR
VGKNRIKFIVILMSISLVGLVSFQLYWINNTIAIEREEFNRKAFEAMERAVLNIEKAETVFYLADRTSQIFHHDTIPGIIYREEEQVVKKFKFSDTVLSNRKKVFKINRPAIGNGAPLPYLERFEIRDSLIGEIEAGLFEMPLPPPPPSLDSVHKEIRQNLEKANNREAVIKQVMKDVLKAKIDPRDRIDKSMLKKYLDEALKNKGLELKYEFAVEAKRPNNFLFASNHNMEFFQNSEFKVKLFPNDIFSSNDFLVIYFPDKYNFILRKTWITLLASVLLIAIILYCFVYAVATLVKQKKLSEMKNDFINNMTHELKTPIATVALTCEALEDPDIKKDERLLQRYISVIRDENKRLGKQVEKVLQIASLDKKDFKLNLKELNVHQVIENAVDHLSLQIHNREGVLDKEFKATSPVLLADELHLTGIIYNLIDNAIKYSSDSPKIKISTEDAEHGILIKVKDHGQGISKDQLSKIFEKFYRIPTGNVHDVKGFGLGLAYVKTITEAHRGRIDVKSVLGEGTEFTIFLPYLESPNSV